MQQLGIVGLVAGCKRRPARAPRTARARSLRRLNQARDYGEAGRRFARLSLEELLAIRGLLEAQRRRRDMEAEIKAINRGVYDGDLEE